MEDDDYGRSESTTASVERRPVSTFCVLLYVL